jgi:hypothetical protein
MLLIRFTPILMSNFPNGLVGSIFVNMAAHGLPEAPDENIYWKNGVFGK